jgi:hypothetical protein
MTMDNHSNPTKAPKARPRQGKLSAALGTIMGAIALIVVLFTSAFVSAQVNTKGDTGIDSSGNYQQERGWCMVNTEGEARVDCLKNSGAAQAEKRRGTLDNNGGNFSANALARCNVFRGDEYATCKARVLGMGGASGSGSVQGGGILKQIETAVPPSSKDAAGAAPKSPS